MRTKDALFLHEKLMLLALRDEKGTVAFESKYPYAVGGAVLAELLLRERVRITKPKRTDLVELVSATAVGDPLVDECLHKIRDAKRRATPRAWVQRFSRVRRLKHRVAERLVERGILRAREDKVLGVFPRKIYPEANPRPERELVEELRKAIFTSKKDLDPNTVVVISLAHRTDLLKMVFDRKKLKERKKRIRDIIEGETLGKAADQAIKAAAAATVVTTSGS